MFAAAISTTSPAQPGAVEEWTRSVNGVRGYRDGSVGGDDGNSARHIRNAGSGVEVDFSAEALEKAERMGKNAAEFSTQSEELSDAEQRDVARLRQRDAEVRRHEQAHVSAGGPYVQGRANYEYTQGPDGRRYATGGEVGIDVSPERTPEATIRKMQVVRRAAMAPADPSPQDRMVAAQASQTEQEARAEKVKNDREEIADEPIQPSPNTLVADALLAVGPYGE